MTKVSRRSSLFGGASQPSSVAGVPARFLLVCPYLSWPNRGSRRERHGALRVYGGGSGSVTALFAFTGVRPSLLTFAGLSWPKRRKEAGLVEVRRRLGSTRKAACRRSVRYFPEPCIPLHTPFSVSRMPMRASETFRKSFGEHCFHRVQERVRASIEDPCRRAARLSRCAWRIDRENTVTAAARVDGF